MQDKRPLIFELLKDYLYEYGILLTNDWIHRDDIHLQNLANIHRKNYANFNYITFGNRIFILDERLYRIKPTFWSIVLFLKIRENENTIKFLQIGNQEKYILQFYIKKESTLYQELTKYIHYYFDANYNGMISLYLCDVERHVKM